MSTFALSMDNTTLLPTLPKVSHHVSGFSTTSTTKVQQLKAWRNGRMSLIVAQSSGKDDGGSMSAKVKYDKVVKELRPTVDNFVNAQKKMIEMRTEYAIAHEEEKLAFKILDKKKQEVRKRQRELVKKSSSSSDEDVVASLYDKFDKELQPATDNFLAAGIKKSEKKKHYETAQKEVNLTWGSWVNKNREITELQRQLGIIAPSSEDHGFASLMLKWKKVLAEVRLACNKYNELKKRVEMGKEESLAWESYQKKRLEVVDLLMQMYILRPGMSFDANAFKTK